MATCIDFTVLSRQIPPKMLPWHILNEQHKDQRAECPNVHLLGSEEGSSGRVEDFLFIGSSVIIMPIVSPDVMSSWLTMIVTNLLTLPKHARYLHAFAHFSLLRRPCFWPETHSPWTLRPPPLRYAHTLPISVRVSAGLPCSSPSFYMPECARTHLRLHLFPLCYLKFFWNQNLL